VRIRDLHKKYEIQLTFAYDIITSKIIGYEINLMSDCKYRSLTQEILSLYDKICKVNEITEKALGLPLRTQVFIICKLRKPFTLPDILSKLKYHYIQVRDEVRLDIGSEKVILYPPITSESISFLKKIITLYG